VLRAQLAQTKRAQVPLEHACSQLRLELDAAHRHLLSSLDNRDAPLRVKDGPSRKANLKMTACKMQNEINDLNRSIGSVKLRLESEIKVFFVHSKESREWY
jgi:Spermatogenesis-associated C-terminus